MDGTEGRQGKDGFMEGRLSFSKEGREGSDFQRIFRPWVYVPLAFPCVVRETWGRTERHFDDFMLMSFTFSYTLWSYETSLHSSVRFTNIIPVFEKYLSTLVLS